MNSSLAFYLGAVAAGLLFGCGAEGGQAGPFDAPVPGSARPEPPLEIAFDAESHARDTLSGAITGWGQTLEFSAVPTGALGARVELHLDSAQLEAQFDFELGAVTLDAEDTALDRAHVAFLSEAAALLAEQADERVGAGFELRMLQAAAAVWQQSGGIPLGRLTFDTRAPGTGSVPKSLGDDGVRCLQRDSVYSVSFDYGSTTVRGRKVRADKANCNGLCGPDCTQPTAYSMWTLDCLEHDECCKANGSADCFFPFGECGDEYTQAADDLLRGFDPFAAHCPG